MDEVETEDEWHVIKDFEPIVSSEEEANSLIKVGLPILYYVEFDKEITKESLFKAFEELSKIGYNVKNENFKIRVIDKSGSVDDIEIGEGPYKMLRKVTRLKYNSRDIDSFVDELCNGWISDLDDILYELEKEVPPLDMKFYVVSNVEIDEDFVKWKQVTEQGMLIFYNLNFKKPLDSSVIEKALMRFSTKKEEELRTNDKYYLHKINGIRHKIVSCDGVISVFDLPHLQPINSLMITMSNYGKKSFEEFKEYLLKRFPAYLDTALAEELGIID